MDDKKREQLVKQLLDGSLPEVFSFERFFDGNDDLGSIGCNLNDHPGVEAFRDVFAKLAARPDVKGVYVQIAEIDTGGGWAFTDTVYVVGDISAKVLADLVKGLDPDVGQQDEGDIHEEIARTHKGETVQTLWWD